MEIHLGNRKITKLVSFSDFANMEILWINKNSLTSLEGLERNFRVKHIFAQENKISTLDRIFIKLKHIETLVLYDNELRDLDKLIKNLKDLKSLKHLDLFGNPAAHEPNYKFRIIAALTSLEVFDRHKITLQERMEAETFMSSGGKNKKIKFHVPCVKGG